MAKWENGLGLPNRASYEALLAYFEITEDAFPLNEEGLRLELISEILIDGKTYPVLYNCYLETDFAIREFSLKDVLYRIEP